MGKNTMEVFKCVHCSLPLVKDDEMYFCEDNGIRHKERYYRLEDRDAYWTDQYVISRNIKIIEIWDSKGNNLIKKFQQETNPFLIDNYKDFCQNLFILL